jgi:hypothetical protein
LNPWERKGTSLFWRATYSFQVQKESIGGKWSYDSPASPEICG